MEVNVSTLKASLCAVPGNRPVGLLVHAPYMQLPVWTLIEASSSYLPAGTAGGVRQLMAGGGAVPARQSPAQQGER